MNKYEERLNSYSNVKNPKELLEFMDKNIKYGIYGIDKVVYDKWDNGIDYDRIIRKINEQEEKDLDIINQGNKQIDELESKILDCKKKLGFKLFKRKK